MQYLLVCKYYLIMIWKFTDIIDHLIVYLYIGKCQTLLFFLLVTVIKYRVPSPSAKKVGYIKLLFSQIKVNTDKITSSNLLLYGHVQIQTKWTWLSTSGMPHTITMPSIFWNPETLLVEYIHLVWYFSVTHYTFFFLYQLPYYLHQVKC